LPRAVRLPEGHPEDPRARRPAGAGVRHLFGGPFGRILFLSVGSRGRLGRPRGAPRPSGAARGGVAHGRESLHLRRELDPVTGTAARLRRLGRPHARARAGAVLLAGAGLGFAIAALGLRLAPHVAGVVGAWLAIAAVLVVAVGFARRVRLDAAPQALGRLVETTVGTRAGSVVGLLAPTPPGGVSADLLTLADVRATRVVEQAAPLVARVLGRGTRRGFLLGVATAAGGAALFLAAAPGAGRAASGASRWRARHSSPSCSSPRAILPTWAGRTSPSCPAGTRF